MAKYSFKIAKKINSDVLKADAWHHRSDAISSIGVAIGILGARFGFPILDPIFGLMVSVIIIYVGVNIVRTSPNFLILYSLSLIADSRKQKNDITPKINAKTD